MPPPGLQGDLALEGSLNHSVLVRRNRERFLVNTLRGRSIRVPPPPPHRRTLDWVMCLGDSDKILCRYIYEDRTKEERFAISVGGSPWRTIEPVGLTWLIGKRAIHDLVFADGAWHYLVHVFDEQRTVLVSVDASSEERVMTRTAEVPFGWHGSRWPRMTAVEGRLTVVAFVEPDLWEIWGFEGGDGWRKKRNVRFDAVKGLLHGVVNLRFDPVVLKEEVMVFACGDCDDWHAYDMKREEACAVEGVEKGRRSSFRIVHSTSVCPWVLVP
ncbi:hypothetical protein QJS10_CPA05g02384 [Acorus calamus]|uniref:F-box associated domain-containing protein n=1 Tax=Acorus calamus TaxID=4465 RepID=A0AAV9EWW4_ACOCL|nr:hypothetical protein QJS10_CPA05g02384 [Acorus calamus]